jgi:LuxR family maltose regulon positive regulatory protein
MPRLANTTDRRRLYPLIKEIPSKKLITVVAGAGYGKTTLAAQAAHYLKMNTIWYRLDSSDRDFTTFIHYLIKGIQKYYPRMGEKTVVRIKQAMVLHRERETILRLFLRELEAAITSNLIIVLDDYHSIAFSEEIRECLHFLFDNMPAKLHMVLISRRDPGLSLSRLRATQDVLDIREDDLAFTTAEIEELYCRLFATRLKQSSLKILQTKTGGWAAGLILLFHYSRGKSPEDIEGFLLKLKGSHRFITNYLEENVYEMLPDPLKDFLRKTSILSRLNADFCDQFLGIEDSGEILLNLEEDHLFTFPFDEERQWYYYHHLFQEFLLTRLKDLDHKTVLDLHKKAAVIWEDLGEEEEALKHYIAASELVTACKLLGKMGRRKLLKEGRLQMIDSFIREIPEDLLRGDPWIKYIQARVFELSGRPFDAVSTYKEAYNLFAGKGLAKYADLCFKGLGYNYFIVGDFQGAETILKELLEKAQDNPRLRFDILGLLILISSHLGKMSDTDQYYQEAMSILPSLNDPFLAVWINFNLGFRYGCSGDYEKAAQLGQRVKETFVKLEFTLYLAMTYHLLAWTSYYLGSFSQGFDHATEGLRLAEEKEINDTTRGWLLMDYALNALGLERYNDAINAAKEALQNFQDLECRWGQSYISHVFQLIHAKLGDYSTAERFARSGLEAIKELDLPMDKGFIMASMAAMFLETGRFDEARPLLEDAIRLLRPTKLFCAQAYLWLARYYRETGNQHDAMKNLVSGLHLSKAGHYDHWIVCEKHWIIPALVEAFVRKEIQGYIKTILFRIGSDATAELTRLLRHKDRSIRDIASALLKELREIPPEGLRVNCLGKFAVYKGKNEIPQERWTSRKAKTIFKILIHERNKGFIPKDVLMEHLWPGQNPDKIMNSFHVALTALRKTLEPGLPKGASSSYLIRNNEAYRLEPGKNGRVDVDIFKEHIARARQDQDQETSIAHYLEAEKLYQGDFLQEDLYENWCAYEREFLQQEYLSILKELMNHFEAKADFEQCIHYALKYLAIDSYDEGIYQNLMRYYSLTGNKGMVAKTYEKCKENLGKGMDLSPDPETEALYRKLI